MIAKRIVVCGKVQGVFFRASTKEKADELGIVGWAMNQLDGSVLIEAEGEEESMNNFISWCESGPLLARVDEIDVIPWEVKGFTSFSIKY